MKNLKKLPQLTVFALSFICILMALSSCVKSSTNNDVPPAKVMVVNTVSGSASQYLELNGNKVNTTAVAYGQTSGYLSALPGTYNGQFINSTSATVNTSFSVTLQPSTYYTIYYTGNDTVKSSFVAQDMVNAPSGSQAAVQFINFSTAIKSAIDISVTGGNKVITNLADGLASTYYAVSANSAFTLSATGSSTTLFSIPALGLQNGNAYTIYITGSTLATISYHLVSHTAANSDL